MAENLVWYASYGSNLSRERFMCYIRGGRPSGSRHAHEGSRDKRPPGEDAPIDIPHELYFARYIPAWDGAVAFVECTRKDVVTLGRMYLIKWEQFIDVVCQENRRPLADPSLRFDYGYAAAHEQFFLNSADPSKPANEETPKWYGRLLNLGQKNGFPIFTFTAEWSDQQIEHIVAESGPPSREYLVMIATGLVQTYAHLTAEQTTEYFVEKRGVKGKVAPATIYDWISQAIQARNQPQGDVDS